jgi:hypothetical protein
MKNPKVMTQATSTLATPTASHGNPTLAPHRNYTHFLRLSPSFCDGNDKQVRGYVGGGGAIIRVHLPLESR